MQGKAIIVRTSYLLCFAAVSGFVFFILFMPDASVGAVKYGLTLCGEIIIPSLFPFTAAAGFICSTRLSTFLDRILLLPSKLLFGCKGKMGTLFLMSVTGGFPVGGKLISDMYGRGEVDDRSASILLSFCMNGGPAFIITAVGTGLMKSTEAGKILFSASVVSALIIGIAATRLLKPQINESLSVEKLSVTEGLISSVCGAGSSLFGICCFTVIFSTVSECIASLLPENGAAIVCSLLEVTNGSIAASKHGIAAVGAALGWGGIAVHFQVFMLAKKIKINFPLFYAGRILHSLLTATLSFLLEKIFPVTTETSLIDSAAYTATPSAAASISLMCMSFVMMMWVYFSVSEAKLRSKGM